MTRSTGAPRPLRAAARDLREAVEPTADVDALRLRRPIVELQGALAGGR